MMGHMDTTTGTTTTQGTTAQPQIDGRSRATLDAMDRFLEAYRLVGTATHACEAAGVAVGTYDAWRTNDLHGFAKRLDQAKIDFASDLECQMFERIKAQKPGDNPTLLIFALKGHLRAKYQDNYELDDTDTHARTLFDELKRRAKADGKAATPKIP